MKILFIEDEARARSGLSALLSSEGHAVDFAESCEAAEKALRLEMYDVIVLDIMLPRGQYDQDHGLATREAGLGLLQELRHAKLKALKTPVDVPVVALTAISDISILDGIRAHRNVVLVQKPVDPEEVAQMIRTVTGEKGEKPNNRIDTDAE